MVFSQSLADRVRHALRDHRGIAEKKMFGGLAFLLHGNMLVGIWDTSLVVRLGFEQVAEALSQDFVEQFTVAERTMKGWIVVEPDAIDTDKQLADWIAKAMRFVETLPAKLG